MRSAQWSGMWPTGHTPPVQLLFFFLRRERRMYLRHVPENVTPYVVVGDRISLFFLFCPCPCWRRRGYARGWGDGARWRTGWRRGWGSGGKRRWRTWSVSWFTWTRRGREGKQADSESTKNRECVRIKETSETLSWGCPSYYSPVPFSSMVEFCIFNWTCKPCTNGKW